MYRCKDKSLNIKMEVLEDKYYTLNKKHKKYAYLLNKTSKLEKPLFYGTTVLGLLLFLIVLKNPYLYIFGLTTNIYNQCIKLYSDVKEQVYNKLLNSVHNEIINLESIMNKMNEQDENKKEMESILERSKEEGIKLSKYHDFRYTEEEAYLFERENDYRYMLESDDIPVFFRRKGFDRSLTGDYENPVFVLMDNKGRVLSKTPKKNNIKK